jgi:hypothetical protein
MPDRQNPDVAESNIEQRHRGSLHPTAVFNEEE